MLSATRASAPWLNFPKTSLGHAVIFACQFDTAGAIARLPEPRSASIGRSLEAARSAQWQGYG
jgi:hypothetical protein